LHGKVVTAKTRAYWHPQSDEKTFSSESMGREKRPNDRLFDLLFWGIVILLTCLAGWAIRVLPFFSHADFY
jgi:hypothetical protein